MAVTLQTFNSAPGTADNLPQTAAKLNGNFSALAGALLAPLSVAAIQTAGTALIADTIVPFDATAGNLVATMPTVPVVNMRVALKKIDATAYTVALTARFNGAVSASTLLLRLQDQGKTFVYAADGTWYPSGGDLSLTTIDARYAPTGDTRFASLTPEMVEPSGIVVGTTDESTYIQSQLVAAASANKAEVKLDARPYAISPGVIQVPPNTTLRIAGESATPRQVVSIGTNQPATSATSGGQFVMLGGTGGSDTSPAYVTLAGPHSALVGASFYDPLNVNTLTTPVAKPFAVRHATYGCTTSRIELINAYRGVDVQAGRSFVEHITGNPLFQGIRVDQAYDFSRIENCAFVPTYLGITLNNTQTALYPWFSANATAYEFLDNDSLHVRGLTSYAYRIGLHLGASPVSGRSNHGSYGSVSDCAWDGALMAVSDDCTQPFGMRFSNCEFTPFGYDSPSSKGYSANAGKVGYTQINGGSMWGTGDVLCELNGGTVELDRVFITPNVYGVVVNNCQIGLYNITQSRAATTRDFWVRDTNSSGRVRGYWIVGNTTPVVLNNDTNVSFTA